MKNTTTKTTQSILIIIGWLLTSFAIGLYFGQYKVTSIFLNNPLDVTAIRDLKRYLPIVANERLYSRKDQNNTDLLKQISNEKWWENNLTPNYKYTKSDIKSTNTQITKEEALQITSLSITNTGIDLEKTKKESQYITNFFRETASYQAYEKLINDYELRAKNIEINYQHDITDYLLETSYLQLRKKNMQEIYKQFPDKNKAEPTYILQQSNIEKHLPLETQIISIQIDINNIQESIIKLNDLIAESEQLIQFSEKAKFVLNNENNGFVIYKKFNDIFMKTQKPSSLSGEKTLYKIASDIENINKTYSKALSENEKIYIYNPPPYTLFFLTGGRAN